MNDIERIRAELEARKHEIDEQVSHYPPPIPACDVQYNYLLEEQRRINLELKKLQERYPAP